MSNKKINVIKMSNNENPFGPSPLALRAAKCSVENINVYPDSEGCILKSALANFYGLDISQITVGNGSENILDMIAKAFLNYKNNAVISQYCFTTILLIIHSMGTKVKIAPALNYGHNINNIIDSIDSQTKVIFIVNPNNPTGTYITHNEMLELLNSIKSDILVVLDEAYYEYVGEKNYPDSLSLLSSYQNLIIVRTFSKIYGMAGLRIGYAMSNPAIAKEINNIRLPFNVNSIAMNAACEALNDKEHVERSYFLNKQGVHQLTIGLEHMGLEVIPSVGNFVCVNIKRDSLDLCQRLFERGIMVKHLLPYNLPFHLRITSGTYEQNQQFLNEFHNLFLEEKMF